MNIAMVPLVNVYSICNLNATQFKVGNSMCGRVEVKYCHDDGRSWSLKTVTNGDNIVVYFIKYVLPTFAYGSGGPPPVHVIIAA